MNALIDNSATTGGGDVLRLSDNASMELNNTDWIQGNTAMSGGGGVKSVLNFPVTSLPTPATITRSNTAPFGHTATPGAAELVASFISGQLPEKSVYPWTEVSLPKLLTRVVKGWTVPDAQPSLYSSFAV